VKINSNNFTVIFAFVQFLHIQGDSE